MAFTHELFAGTKANPKAVSRKVEYPSSIAELKQGIGPWASVSDLMADAFAHRNVIIQNEMRQEIAGKTPVNGGGRPKFSDD